MSDEDGSVDVVDQLIEERPDLHPEMIRRADLSAVLRGAAAYFRAQTGEVHQALGERLAEAARRPRVESSGEDEGGREQPERIYLEPPPGSEHEGRMWCEDQIEDDWTEYVRADRLQAAEERVREMEGALREIAYGTTDEVTDRDNDGVPQGGFTRFLTRDELRRIAERTLGIPPRRPVRKHTPGSEMVTNEVADAARKALREGEG